MNISWEFLEHCGETAMETENRINGACGGQKAAISEPNSALAGGQVQAPAEALHVLPHRGLCTCV